MDLLEHDGAEAQVEISLSVDETNALRAKLGLKPLTMTKTDEQVKAESNFDNQQNDLKRKANVAEVQRRLERSRNRLKLRGKLVGNTLGNDTDTVLDDVNAWTKRQKTQTNLAKRYDDEEQVVSVSMDDKGVIPSIGVAHDFDSTLAEGSEMILTLMDKNVLDEDEQDILENVDLRNAEKIQQSLDTQKRTTIGFGNDLEQVTMGRYKQRSILSQYDDIVDGEHVPRTQTLQYTLTEDGICPAPHPSNTVSPEQLLNAKAMSLEYEKQRAVDNFKSTKEVSIKKPNKKGKLAKLRSRANEEMLNDNSDDLATNRSNEINMTYNFVDDEDLQSVLASARHHTLKRQPPPTIDEIEKDLALNCTTTAATEETELGGLVFDEVSEFVRGLDPVGIFTSVVKQEQPTESMDVNMTDMCPIKPEPIEDTLQSNPLVDEVALDGGLASALEFFRKRGDLDVKDDVMAAREQEYRDREQWEVHNMVAINQAGLGGRESSKANLKRRAETHADRLKDYKPNVNIEYFDERGLQLSTKDAFKELSHKFHGRGPGKNKIEKLMRKEEEKRRQLSMASGDRASELTQVMMDRQKLLGTAAIQLTEGNRPVSANPTLVGSSKNNHSKSNKLQRRA